MPAPYDVVYMLLDKQLYSGQRMINRYFYGAEISASPNAADLAAEFNATMMPLITQVQTAQVEHTNIVCVNLSDITDYVDLGISDFGQETGDGMPPHSPVGFRASQAGYGIRPGGKRISGFPEAWQSGGLVNTTVGQLLQMATALGMTLEGDDAAYYPITVEVPSPFVPPLPVVPVNRDAINWTIRPYVSTQMTRKLLLG